MKGGGKGPRVGRGAEGRERAGMGEREWGNGSRGGGEGPSDGEGGEGKWVNGRG